MQKRQKRIRADELLYLKNLCESRSQAKALIMAGQVKIGSERIEKAGRLLTEDSELSVKLPMKYVGRGGLKMENFLKDSKMQVNGMEILDIGASTGGFTDCLLQHGAIKAICIDVGHGQLHYRLRTDKRVTNLEKTNIRHIEKNQIKDSPFPLIVMDLSFISLRKTLSNAWPLLESGGTLVALVKPQFECSKKEADHGKGVIRDASIQGRILEEIKAFGNEVMVGAELIFETEARPSGTDGNKEFFLAWKKQD